MADDSVSQEPKKNQVVSLIQIESEIKGYQTVGGQAIYEIGRRLKYVKHHDLVHGEFGNWLAKMQIDHTFAVRAMKIAEEFKDSSTLPNVGASALAIIASLPADEREAEQTTEDGESKKPTDMSVRELRELRKRLKGRDQQVSDLFAENQRLKANAETPKSVEVVPPDYEKAKANAKDFAREVDYLRKQNKKLHSELDDMQSERDSATDDSQQNALDKKIAQLTGKLTASQVKADAIADMVDFKGQTIDLLNQLAPELYKAGFAQFSYDDPAMETLRSTLGQVEQWLTDIRAIMPANIQEGEIING